MCFVEGRNRISSGVCLQVCSVSSAKCGGGFHPPYKGFLGKLKKTLIEGFKAWSNAAGGTRSGLVLALVDLSVPGLFITFLLLSFLMLPCCIFYSLSRSPFGDILCSPLSPHG